MDYLYLAPLFIIFYMVAVDRNLGEYLYLKLWDEPALWLRTAVLKYRLLLSLRYDRFLMGRGIVPRRFYDMAKELRDPADDPK
jgi:hypothetical protein